MLLVPRAPPRMSLPSGIPVTLISTLVSTCMAVSAQSNCTPGKRAYLGDESRMTLPVRVRENDGPGHRLEQATLSPRACGQQVESGWVGGRGPGRAAGGGRGGEVRGSMCGILGMCLDSGTY